MQKSIRESLYNSNDDEFNKETKINKELLIPTYP